MSDSDTNTQPTGSDDEKASDGGTGGVTVQGPSDDAPATQGFGGGDPTAGTGGADESGAGDTTIGDGETLVNGDESDVPTGHQAAQGATDEVDRGAQGRMRE
ncbi:hypothetical protein [Planctomonas psychrotolerans]|uniref:hypothetical protein n=1 Tax=Planctomonas psychrotolerans TaxID=2528712 RepID=UPI00123C0CA8|nr:hypothetical protein [Planctomonas psychrotolerans]